ncbi:hypothetical protein BOTBODRAFT_181861 [Botryobasidium botryosum FD-172 SS1]|uniref:Uncharacterized protein n=1 Tax=Botryobasidium botryosum (strain FD-172 SS1) TaxID=930990 RepID=A0A067LSW2_BOTB1|nr:hypothetical protein BOTBODRAFT_181861 [Botryobasidium botryosum FD-172 SS1]
MSAFYSKARTFRRHHQGINCLCFSKSGLLASGGEDRLLCIWDASSGQLLYEQECQGNVTCLLWKDADTLVCGTGEGFLSIISFDASFIEILEVHVLCLAFYTRGDKELICAAGRGVIIMLERDLDDGLWTFCGARAALPRADVVTSLNFLNNGSTVVASYATSKELPSQRLLAGLALAGASQNEACYKDVINYAPSGSLSIASDDKLALIHNLKNGFDLISMASGSPVRSFHTSFPPAQRQRPLPVAFGQGETIAIAGDADGRVLIWKAADGLELQILEHEVNQQIFYLSTWSSALGTEHQIAVATETPEGANEIHIWCAGVRGGQKNAFFMVDC